MTPQELKNSILQRAFEGKLVQGIENELPIKELTLEEEPFDIPERWCWQLLGNCCEMYTGNSISATEKKAKYEGLPEGYDYIATKDVEFNQTISYNNGVKIPFDTTFKIAVKGSVLMCIEGGSAGRKIGILDRNVCFGNKLCTFNSSIILNKYIYYYLQSYAFRKCFSGSMTGIIGGVSIKKLKGIPIPIPSLEEQKCIVAKIEELLPYIGKYEKAWTKLETFNKKFPDDMQKSILQMAIQGKLVEQREEEGSAEELYKQIQEEKQKLFKEGKLKKRKEKPLDSLTDAELEIDIPRTWKLCKLADITSNITDGEHKTPKRIKEFCGYYLLSARNIRNGYIALDNVDYVDEDEFNIISKRCNPKQNDVLISCSGSIGRCTVVEDSNNYVMVRSAAMISPIVVNSKYLMYTLQSSYVQSQIKKRSKQTAQANLFQEAIRNLVIPLPPVAEQSRIVEKIEALIPMCAVMKI